MARARNIKPGFFTNEVLAALPPLTRLLFIGLWTEADREGRLEDRPRRLHLRLFPEDEFDINMSIQQLADAGFIHRYNVDGVGYIQITNWHKHQRPHFKEAASVIPVSPIGNSLLANSLLAKSPKKVSASTNLGTAQPGSSTNLGRCEHRLIPDTGYLIPDCGERIPDSDPLPRLAPAQPSLLEVDPTAEFYAAAEEIVQTLPAGGDVRITANYIATKYAEDLTYYDNPRGFADYMRDRAKVWRKGYDKNPSLRPKTAHYWVLDGEFKREPSLPVAAKQNAFGMRSLADLVREKNNAS